MSLSGCTIPACFKFLGRILVGAILFISVFAVVRAELPPPDITRIFPADLSGFHRMRSAQLTIPVHKDSTVVIGDDYPRLSLPTFGADTEYLSPDGEKLHVEIVEFESDSAAYAWFTGQLKRWREVAQIGISPVDGVCTASAMSSSQSLACFKGSAFVTVASENGKNSDRVKALTREFAETLDGGEGEVPVLVKHLPNFETAQHSAVFAVSRGPLLSSIVNQPILGVLTFEGGTEAVTANYGQSQLLIVEFTTPQFSIGNDSVFVFNAPDEKSANALIDSVKYEQVIQWLGDDPYLEARVERYLAQTTAGVLIAVLKSSGLSLLICLGAGTFFGALLFRPNNPPL